MSEDWIETTLHAVADVVMGQSPPGDTYNTTGLGLPFLQGSAEFGEHHPKPVKWCSAPTKVAEIGDLMVSVRAPVGDTNFADQRIAIGRGLAIVRGKSGALSSYLRLVLQHESAALLAASGSGMFSSITGANLRAFPILLPPVEVQSRIVDLIEHLDSLISSLRTEQSILDSAWWAAAREMIIEVQTSQSSLVPLGDLSEISGGVTKNANKSVTGRLVEVPYLRVANVHRRYLDLTKIATITVSSDVAERLALRPGDVLMNEGGDKDKLGRGSVWRGEIEGCVHQNHVFRARIVDSRFIPDFVSAWANSYGQKWFETFGTQTTGIASVSKSTLSKFPVPTLPIERQKVWTEALQAIVDHMFALQSELETLSVLRDRTLNAVLSGGIAIPSTYDALLEQVA